MNSSLLVIMVSLRINVVERMVMVLKGAVPPRVDRTDTEPSVAGLAVLGPVIILPTGDSGSSTVCKLLADPSPSQDNGSSGMTSVLIRLLD